MIHRNQVQGLSALTLTSFLLILLARFLQPAIPSATLWILAWAGGESLINFYGLSRSLTQSNRTFFTWFAGGALIRLASLGVAAYGVTARHMPPAAPLLALVAAYFILSLVQLPFFKYGLR